MRHLATVAVGTVALLLSARPPVRPSVSPRPPACDPGDGDITLPEGTALTFHFDEPFEVPVRQSRL